MIEILLDSVELTNWQSYHGKGNIFDFTGPESTNNSSIIVAKNAQGKSAFFEAVKFVLYGPSVIVDRDSTTKPKRRKPLVSKDRVNSPLMNYEAWKDGERSFGVKAKLTLDGSSYTIERSYTSKVKQPGINDLESEFYILEDAGKKKVPNPEEWINSILPEGITKFFTIDGELLVEYRRIFQADRAGLSDDIETILRLNSLDAAAYQVSTLKTGWEKEQRKIEAQKEKDAAIAKDLRKLNEDIEFNEEKKQEAESTLSVLDQEISELWKWLQSKGNQTGHLEKLEDLEEKIVEINKTIEDNKSKRANQLRNSWKQVLSVKATMAHKGQKRILDRQRENRKTYHELQAKIMAKSALIEGETCPSCEQEKKVSVQEKVKLSEEIELHQIEVDALEKQSKTPDPYPVMNKMERLNQIMTDTNYADTDQISKQIASDEIKLIGLNKDREAVLDDLGEANLKEGRDKRAQHATKVTQANSIREEKLPLYIRNIEQLTNQRNIKQKKGSKTIDDDELKNTITKASIAQLLTEITNEAKAPFRESTRKTVSTIAEEIYLGLIDKNEGHASFEFDSRFRVKVYYENDDEVILTPGQKALATYCILEALSIVSDITFPLIVDSPGQGVDKEYIQAIFSKILADSNRQVIVIPTTAEIATETMVEDFGSEVSSIHELTRAPHSRKTIIKQVHKRGK